MKLSTLVFPEITLHVFALESSHLYSEAFESIESLQFQLLFILELPFQVCYFFFFLAVFSVIDVVSLCMNLEMLNFFVSGFKFAQNSV
jgi:hypothetical protein